MFNEKRRFVFGWAPFFMSEYTAFWAGNSVSGVFFFKKALDFGYIRKTKKKTVPISKISSKVALQLVRTVRQYFPDICSRIDRQVTDLRDSRGKAYSMHEAILSTVMMFLLREGSRNSYNQDREEPRFSRNIRRLLGIRLMHGDAFNEVLKISERIRNMLVFAEIDPRPINKMLERKIQIRFE